MESFTQQATICLFIKRGNAKQDKGWEEGHGGGEEKVSVYPDKLYTYCIHQKATSFSIEHFIG